jgi:SAM-dependent methyltransferase
MISGEPKIEWETVACPMCKGRQARQTIEAGDLLYRLPGTFRLMRCCDCGHYYLNPRPTSDCIQAFYPPQYGPHHLESAAEDDIESAAKETERKPWYLRFSLHRIPPLRAFYRWLEETHGVFIPTVSIDRPQSLEVGCADGGFLRQLQDHGWEVTGIEPSPAAAAAARQCGFDVHTGTLEPGFFPDESFDAVFAWMVVEHLHDPLSTLREMRRILRPDGWLLFSVPNYGCWESAFFGRYWYSLQLPTHLHHFTRSQLRRMLRSAGFQIVQCRGQHNVHNLVGSLGIWLRETRPSSPLGDRLIRWTDYPGLAGRLALAPVAKLLAWSGQAGRLTVAARPRIDT